MRSETAAVEPVNEALPSTSTGSLPGITTRMDRLPATRYAWTLVLLLSLGGFFEIYDLIFTGYIAPGMVKSGLLATTTAALFGFKGIGSFIAVTFAGLFVGTFLFGFIPNRYGRRPVFTYSLLWYCACSAIMAFQTTSEGLLFWRFVAGIGVGIEIVTIDSYITELVSHKMRGQAMALSQGIMFCAAPVAAFLSYKLVPTAPFGFEGWRWVVLIGSAGALLVWFIRRQLPESPRWLAHHGRQAEAERIMAGIEARVADEYGQPLPPAPPASEPVRDAASFKEVWQPPYRSRFLMLLVFNFFQAFAFYGFSNWVPTLLIAHGITVTKSLLYSSIIAIASPVGPLLAFVIADRIQRKWIIVGAAVATAVLGIIFSRVTSPAPIILIGVLISLAGSALSVAYHTYQTELFPTAIRCRATGVSYSTSRIGAMLSGFIVAYFLRNYGVLGVFVAISAAMLVVILSIGLFGPKTNGLRLEEISR